MLLLDEAEVQQEIRRLEPHVRLEPGVTAQRHGPVPDSCAFGFHVRDVDAQVRVAVAQYVEHVSLCPRSLLPASLRATAPAQRRRSGSQGATPMIGSSERYTSETFAGPIGVAYRNLIG
ncbi:hypothetical protein GCM10010361_10150 [Streptomyces olivaceiscleroticus]|uniref:Uncharacterized protein n=1 Tax=Streptomyces olivaceiscleroticus TaxID=68245 RepID=A0ABN0ZHV0_9ACTN